MNRPYPRYRPSRVEWLGEVPEHWEVRPLGRMGSFFKGGGGTKADEIEGGIPCIRYGDLYTQHEFCIRGSRAGISEENVGAYRRLRHGDVLFAGSGETIEEIGKSAVNLITERAYCGGDVIVFRPTIEVDAAFLGYAADCRPATYQKVCMGRGVTVMHIYSSALKNLLLPLPPVHEQQAIATFLDRKTGEIDALVAQKRLLIERLAEYRTALITRTVTRGLPPEEARAAGLDPNPRLRHSRVEWLGEVPEHWEIKQLGSAGSFSKGGGGTKEDEVEGGIPCVRYGDLYTQHEFCIRASRAGITEESTRNYQPLRYGDMLFAGSGETIEEIGKSAVSLMDGRAYCGGDVIVFRPSIEMDATFLGYAGDCRLATYQKARMGRGVTVMHIYSSELKHMLIPLPPVNEQRAIAVFLDQRVRWIDDLCSRVVTAIERLQEYRIALVAAAVTGKIDVRDATATEMEGHGA